MFGALDRASTRGEWLAAMGSQQNVEAAEKYRNLQALNSFDGLFEIGEAGGPLARRFLAVVREYLNTDFPGRTLPDLSNVVIPWETARRHDELRMEMRAMRHEIQEAHKNDAEVRRGLLPSYSCEEQLIIICIDTLDSRPYHDPPHGRGWLAVIKNSMTVRMPEWWVYTLKHLATWEEHVAACDGFQAGCQIPLGS
jgi:hypothetical protein